MLRKPQITIANYTPLTIYKVFVTECKDREKFKNTPYSGTLLVENIHTNEFIVKEYRAQCVDITAYDKDGFVVGRQVNVSIPPNLVWKIRN
ncbi:MAG: hypothetical protein R3240_11655 [Gammaproteobacteria bacterium]|nr:hypothetical protein [Gammaproteobacteria bacterium]